MDQPIPGQSDDIKLENDDQMCLDYSQQSVVSTNAPRNPNQKLLSSQTNNLLNKFAFTANLVNKSIQETNQTGVGQNNQDCGQQMELDFNQQQCDEEPGSGLLDEYVNPNGGHITPTVKQLIAQNKLQSDAQSNNLLQGTPMPIQNDLNSQSSCVVPSPSKSDLSCFINSVQPTPQKQKSTQDSAADGPQSSQLQQQDSKINKMFKKYEKAINEKWKKALKYLGINENLFPSRKDEIETYYPFSQYNLENVRKGVFMQQQLERIVLEITNIDNNAQCYHAKFKDLKGEEIFGTFHNDCKDNIRNLKMRKGSIVILKEVSCFSIVHDKYYQIYNEYRNQSIKI